MFEGEVVERGDVVSDGPESPHDILRLRGVHAIARYITNECRKFTVCKALRLTISTSKLYVRQMLRKGAIVSAGGSSSWKASRLKCLASRLPNRRLESEE